MDSLLFFLYYKLIYKSVFIKYFSEVITFSLQFHGYLSACLSPPVSVDFFKVAHGFIVLIIFSPLGPSKISDFQ